MVALEGDCKTPIGAFAEQVGAEMRLRAFYVRADDLRRADERIPWPSEESARSFGLAVGASLKS
jgi:porphobilinogen deaminase